MKTHAWYTPYLFILLAVTGLVVFRLGPILFSLGIGFTDWNPYGNPSFVGLQNFRELLGSREFWQLFGNTMAFSAIFVVSVTVLSLLLAVLLNTEVPGRTGFRILAFAPVVTSTVAVGIVWAWIFGSELGALNFLLRSLGVSNAPSWLRDHRFALSAVSAVNVWRRIGFYMIIFLAGLQEIPRTLLEAATIDGAGGLRRFWRITVPLLTPIVFFVLVMSLFDSFGNFEIIFTMTRGGPGKASATLSYSVYQYGFEMFQMGFASSIATVLLAIVGLLTYINFRYKSRWVNYQY